MQLSSPGYDCSAKLMDCSRKRSRTAIEHASLRLPELKQC
uniref:Uncharacterized protein n=1 Tax=Anguilla anguilla TaxID=7936 RepID=A0A0E9PG64_ANGAN